jgi:hypothetical protein
MSSVLLLQTLSQDIFNITVLCNNKQPDCNGSHRNTYSFQGIFCSFISLCHIDLEKRMRPPNF